MEVIGFGLAPGCGGSIGAAPIVAAGPVAVHDPGQKPPPGLAVGGALKRRVVGLSVPTAATRRRTGRGGSRAAARLPIRWSVIAGTAVGGCGVRLDRGPVEHEPKPVDAAGPHLAKVGRVGGLVSLRDPEQLPALGGGRGREGGKEGPRWRPPTGRAGGSQLGALESLPGPGDEIATRAASSARLGPAPALTQQTTGRHAAALDGARRARASSAPRRSRCRSGSPPPGRGRWRSGPRAGRRGPTRARLASLARQKLRLGDRSAFAGGALTAAGTRKVLGILIDRRRTGHRGGP